MLRVSPEQIEDALPTTKPRKPIYNNLFRVGKDSLGQQDAMMPKATLEDAIALALFVHRGVVDKGGAPYILHPLRVMMRFDSADEQIVSALHDVVEDSEVTLDDLRERGFSADVVRAVDALTRRSDETYEDFITRAAADPIARVVKLADIEDNLDLRRLKVIDEKAIERLQRYRVAWETLTQRGCSFPDLHESEDSASLTSVRPRLIKP